MIKVVGLLTRKPEFTHEEFVKHWLEIHGPLAHAVPGVRRYVQSHIIGTRTRSRSMGLPNFGTMTRLHWRGRLRHQR
jgi:uncharacterized protein (TIGR02118 family)